MITLVLTTQRGAELGRLPMEHEALVAAGGVYTRLRLAEGMTRLYRRIEETLHAEGFDLAVAPELLQKSLAIALLNAPDNGGAMLPVAVIERPGGTSSITGGTSATKPAEAAEAVPPEDEPSSGSAPASGQLGWDDLFSGLNFLPEPQSGDLGLDDEGRAK